MLNKAIEVARNAFEGMVDEFGNPYVEHSCRIMEQMDTEDEKIVAMLHDVVEDTEVSLSDLQSYGFSRMILDTVGQLTKRSDRTYFDYIDDISGSELATKIKIAEVRDNKDIFRVRKMSFQTYKPEERARRVLSILQGENIDINYK